MPLPRRSLVAVPLVVVPLCALLLAGCVPAEDPLPSSSPTRTSSPSATASPSPTASSAPDQPSATPVDIACDRLVSAQQIYDFNPNFAPQPSYVPATGSPGARALQLDGVACAWVNESSGELIEMSVARPVETELAQRRSDLFSTSNSVPTYGAEGFFVNADGVGTAEVFDGPYWVAAWSVAFFEPGDVAPLMAAALSALP